MPGTNTGMKSMRRAQEEEAQECVEQDCDLQGA